MAPANNNNDDRERRKAAGSAINAFAEQKGVTRSIRNFKHRQETKQNIKASRLREYRKVMRKEGMEAGRGGGRRRGGGDEEEANAKNDATKEDDARIRHKRKPKMNPLTKSLQKKQLLLDQQQEDRLQHQVDAKQSEKRQKQRHRQAKLLSRKTQRGQPVMKHMINSLLVKLEDK